MNYWLIKSEPAVYSFSQLQREGATVWDGIRNYGARNNLRAMAVGDRLLYYHSNVGKEIVGIAEVSAAAFPEGGQAGKQWYAIEVAPVAAFSVPVSLALIKETPALAGMALIRQSRLSVCPVSAAEYGLICKMGGLKEC